MNEDRTHLSRLLLSGFLAVPFFVGGWLLIPREGSWGALVPILGAMLCFVLGAILLAFPLARLFAEPWGSLYFPSWRPQQKAPMYGIPQAKRKQGQFESAMALYEAIVNEYPGELRAYVEMMDMAVVDLKDLRRAERIYEQARTAIQNEDDLRALDAMYRAISSRATRPAPPVKPVWKGWQRLP